MSNESSRSPFWRHGIVVPVALVQLLEPWLSSKVRKELPVVELRSRPKWANVVAAVDSGWMNATLTFDLPGTQPPADVLNAHWLGDSSLVPPRKHSSFVRSAAVLVTPPLTPLCQSATRPSASSPSPESYDEPGSAAAWAAGVNAGPARASNAKAAAQALRRGDTHRYSPDSAASLGN